MGTFQKTTLDNGLTIIAECDHNAHTAAVGFFVKAGTRDETPDVMGVSHFLEHMMFKGTARRTADEVNQEFDRIGADYNAYTSHEKTVYYAHVLPEYLPRSIDLIGDMLRPALRDEDFQMEKKVILEEISMYNDRPQWRLQDTLLENYFAGHPLGYRVLGTTRTIETLTPDQMRQYFSAQYCPGNMVVSGAGRIDFDAFVHDIQTITSSWKPTGATRDMTCPTVHPGQDQLVDPKLNRHYIALICPGPAAQDEQRYAASVLADVLGDSEGSHLYWALVDQGLADEADLSHIGLDGVGCFMAYVSCDPGRARQVESVLLQVLNDAQDKITDEEVLRTKNKLATGATVHGESPAGRMRAMGSQWLHLGHYLSLKEEVQRLMAVTRQDICQLLQSQQPFGTCHVLRLGPGVTSPKAPPKTITSASETSASALET